MANITSLWEMLNIKNDNQIKFVKKINSITIPKIQRDYAQGRTDEKTNRIRKKFLEDLFERMKENKSTVLDFVYGSIENTSMLPLDGQQRLTTLFLMHVYAYKLLNKKDENIENCLIHFSYDTRETARKFCESIVKEDFNILNNKENSLKKEIENQMWYFDAYKFDQTIQAMLVTLDHINRIFYDYYKDKTDENSLWYMLTQWKKDDNDRAIGKIRFHFLELEKFKLTDDLYIKMNARGKSLTDFENFRAEVIELIKDDSENDKDTKQFLEDPNNDFAFKTDVDWTNMLWKIRNTQYEDLKKYNYLIDYAYMRILATCIIASTDHSNDGKYIIQQLGRQEQRSNLIDFFRYTKCTSKDADPISNNNDKIEKEHSQKIFDDFKNILNTYLEVDKNIDYKQFDKIDKLPDKIKFWNFKDKKIFRDLVFDENIWSEEDKKENYLPQSAKYASRILFLAQTWYLSQTKDYTLSKIEENDDTSNYEYWMRIIRNFIEIPDPQINKNETKIDVKMRKPIIVRDMIKLMRTLTGNYKTEDGNNSNKGLSSKEQNIYKYLASDEDIRPEIKDKTLLKQLQEERAKAKVVEKNETVNIDGNEESKKKIIFDLEDNYLLHGSIEFALYCLGKDVYADDFDWNSVDWDNIDWRKLYRISKVLNKYFNDEKQLPSSFRKAMLTMKDDNGKYENFDYSKINTKNIQKAFFVNMIDLMYILRLKDNDNIKYTRCCFKNLIQKLIEDNYFKSDSPFEMIINEGLLEEAAKEKRQTLFDNWKDEYKAYIYVNEDGKEYIETKDNSERIML